jgi:hypothetical protein
MLSRERSLVVRQHRLLLVRILLELSILTHLIHHVKAILAALHVGIRVDHSVLKHDVIVAHQYLGLLLGLLHRSVHTHLIWVKVLDLLSSLIHVHLRLRHLHAHLPRGRNEVWLDCEVLLLREHDRHVVSTIDW